MTSPLRYKCSQVPQSLRWTKYDIFHSFLLLFSGDLYLVTTLRGYRDCCFVTSHEMILQWSRLVTLMWPPVEVSIVKSPLLLLCVELQGDITMKSHGDSQMITCQDSTVKSSWALFSDKSPFWYPLETRPKVTIMMISQWDLKMRVTWEWQGVFSMEWNFVTWWLLTEQQSQWLLCEITTSRCNHID